KTFFPFLIVLLPLTAPASGAATDAPAALLADRTAIERVYYAHRLGNKPPFEQALPPATIEHLVSLDLKKETLLKNAYGLEPDRKTFFPFLIVLLPLTAPASGAATDAPAALLADRTAIERVYYAHRLGNKPPFEQALPPATIEHLVSLDLKKETLLKNAYGLE